MPQKKHFQFVVQSLVINRLRNQMALQDQDLDLLLSAWGGRREGEEKEAIYIWLQLLLFSRWADYTVLSSEAVFIHTKRFHHSESLFHIQAKDIWGS